MIDGENQPSDETLEQGRNHHYFEYERRSEKRGTIALYWFLINQVSLESIDVVNCIFFVF